MLRLPLVLVALIIAPFAHALAVRPPGFSELVRTADAVIIGEVTRCESVLRTVERRAVPFTLVTIRITETLKGLSAPTITLEFLGGVVGSESLRIAGAPEFAPGDRGFFFVQNNGTQFFPLVGVVHGIYWLVRDEQSVEYVLRADHTPLVSSSGVSAPLKLVSGQTGRSTSSGRALTAAEFARQIKAEATHATR